MKVFVIDSNKQPLDPCSAGKARRLLAKGKGAICRRYPFTIILHRAVEKPEPQPLRFKIDPGAKTSGLALVNDQSGEVVWAAELQHRGWPHTLNGTINFGHSNADGKINSRPAFFS